MGDVWEGGLPFRTIRSRAKGFASIKGRLAGSHHGANETCQRVVRRYTSAWWWTAMGYPPSVIVFDTADGRGVQERSLFLCWPLAKGWRKAIMAPMKGARASSERSHAATNAASRGRQPRWVFAALWCAVAAREGDSETWPAACVIGHDGPVDQRVGRSCWCLSSRAGGQPAARRPLSSCAHEFD